MRIKIFAGCGALAFSLLVNVGCEPAGNVNGNVNGNLNANAMASNANVSNTSGATMRQSPDGSEIEVTEAGGVKTETRTFADEDGRVERVVVTTRDGKRTARVYSRSGEVKDLSESDVERALEATGDTLADAAGFVAGKSKDAASATKEGLETAAEKTGDFASEAKDKTEGAVKKTGEAAKTVGEKTADGARTVGEKTADGARTAAEKTGDAAKTVGKKTAEGAKKVGGAIKDAVTP